MEHPPSLFYLSDRFPWEESSYVGSFKFLWVASVPLGYRPVEISPSSSSSCVSCLYAMTMAPSPGQADHATKKILDWIDSLFTSVTEAVMLMQGEMCINEERHTQPVCCSSTTLVTKYEIQDAVAYLRPVCSLPGSFPSELQFLPLDTYLSDLRSNSSSFTDIIEPVSLHLI